MLKPSIIRRSAACILSCMLFFSGCAALRYQDPGPNDSSRLRVLHARLQKNHKDFTAARDIGAIYLRLNYAGTAGEYISRAYQNIPEDPKTKFYMGLYTEIELGIKEALQVYSGYSDVPITSPYRKMMMGRYTWLSEQLIIEEMQQRLAEEASLPTAHVDSLALAIFPLDYIGTNPSYEHLGRAFSELVLTDLAQLSQIKLVERIRVNTLLDELQLAADGLTDPAVSPRLGKLLGAGKMAGGNINLDYNEALKVGFAQWESDNSTAPAISDHNGSLQQLMRVEKEVVYTLLNQLGIQPTPEEQERIEHIPTQNMQAFLAYSRGLGFRDRGLYQMASTAFGEAAALDPGFTQAASEAAQADALAAAGGDANAAIEAANQAALAAEEGGDDLVGLRMSILSNGPAGAAGRQPAAEAVSAQGGILPAPPTLPSNN